MREQLTKILVSLVVSDQYLDREEEELFWHAVNRTQMDPQEAESLLLEILEQHQAERESTIYQELKVYLSGPLRDGLLDFEEEENSHQWLLQCDHIPFGVHKRLIYEACRELGAHVASELIDELIDTFRQRYQMPLWSEQERRDAEQWAITRWSGITGKQVWELLDSYLD